MDFLTNLCIGLGCLVVAQSSVPQGPADSQKTATAARGISGSSPPMGGAPGNSAKESGSALAGRSPVFVILNGPQDLDELWRKIERPDLILLKGDRIEGSAIGANGAGSISKPSRSVVESVRISGKVGGESADLAVEYLIALSGGEEAWVPIRLDHERVKRAQEGVRDLSLRAGERGEWQVSLTGEGEHRIRVDLRATVTAELARRKLSIAIPEAQSTRVELNFAGHESDVVIGTDEDFGMTELGQGKGSLLAAHLSPRSKLELSWSDNAKDLSQAPPLLTAQVEIAIDIDAQQMRTRSSWSIRCVRGIARSLELKVDDADQITGLELDDQSLEDEIEQARGPGKLSIPLDDPIHAGASKRLVLRTRRGLTRSVNRRIAFTGFPLSSAREQSGYIGITRSPNLYVGSSAPLGVYRIDASKLPAELRARPSTSLAYEFPDQPFSLDLLVEPSPPQIRAETRTLFQIDSDKARSDTTIDLSWVRGDLFELELGVAPRLQVMAVGPSDSVESTNLTEGRLSIRLTPRARQRGKVSLKLAAIEPITAPGSNELGVFSLHQAVAGSALYALAAGRGLSLELEDVTGSLRRAPEIASRFQISEADSLEAVAARRASPGTLFLIGDGSSKNLPVRIAHQERRLRHETSLTATVSPRSVDVVERVAVSVRHGALNSLDIRVPAAFADRWELLERQEVDIQERLREPDGSTHYRLTFARPVLEQSTLRFRYRLLLLPALGSAAAREVTIPAITIEEGEAGQVKVLLELAPEIVVEGAATGWVRALDDVRIEPALLGPYVQISESGTRDRSSSFSFKARALEKVALPTLVVPRLLIKTTRGSDGIARTTVRYWVELHGPDFPFSLPRGLECLEARVDGRIAERMDFDQTKSEYRLHFKGDAQSKPALVELDIQEALPGSSMSCRLPELLDGGLVLQALWEVRLPWSMALVGIPRGWSDENRWSWSGLSFKRGPEKEEAGLSEWLLGSGAAGSAIDLYTGSRSDQSDRYLFSRRGQPAALEAWIVPGAWLVGVCSGLMLVIGFLAIFFRFRFRTIWLAVAALAVLAAVLVEPSVSLLVLQSAALGAALSVLGLLIERTIERANVHSTRAPRGPGAAMRPAADSSLKGPSAVGSDDSTAIRVRVPSTVDHAPQAVAVVPDSLQEARSSTVQRA